MTITHHPSDATLAAFAAGTLDEGRSVVVATHLSTCPTCRNAARTFERVGGAALDEAEPVAMTDDAFARALDAIAADAPAQAARRATQPDVPPTLASYGLGKWRWIGPGIYWRPVDVPADQGTRVFMLKAAPGTVLPEHRHTGVEWTCILQGAFRHQHGRYGTGDFDEADESVEHHPAVEDGMECICLVAMQGNIQFKSWIGRAIQSFVRI